MLTQEIFADRKEIERLRVQSRLLTPCESPVIARLLDGKSGMKILDLGCNNGEKTRRYFSSPAVSRVLGLEFSSSLAEEAQQLYGDHIFQFYSCDCGSASAEPNIRALMARCGIESFDIIYLSFVLMHLPAAESVLTMLSGLLAPGGVLLIAEPYDDGSFLSGEGAALLREFLSILGRDLYAGNRSLGAVIPAMLERSGYLWQMENETIGARPGETQKKQDIYTTFFTYLEDDLAILMRDEPENESYRRDAAWLADKLPQLRSAILRDDTEISMGFRILTARRRDDA